MDKKLFKNLIPLAIAIVGIFVIGAIIFVNQGGKKEETQSLSAQEIQQVAEKTVDFINKNLLGGQVTASLVNAVEEYGLIKLKIEVAGNEIDSYVSKDGKVFFPEAIDLIEIEPVAVEESSTIGNFSVSGDEVCKEESRPIVYFFGSEECSYCQWEHPIIEEVAAKFEGEIAFHNNMDSDADREIFSKYSTGGIPTLVFGCKYYRVGAGSQAGEEGETKNLTALICKLTDGKPADVCSQVQDLINQIES